MNRTLSLACWDYDRTRPLADGRVTPRGIELLYLTLPVEETFFRMARFREFDVAEMSLSSYVLTLARQAPFVAIPVFPSRAFRHGGIYVNTRAGIQRPEDLAGRIVGVPEYQMTAAVWIRGILAEHHGVAVDSVRYRTGGLHTPGRVEKLDITPPGVEITPIPPDATLNDWLVEGRIDALYTARPPRAFRHGHPAVDRLWQDPRPAESAYYRTTSIFPIMHTIVIRRDVYERDRWLARSLYEAFREAKDIAAARMEDTTAPVSMLPWTAEHYRQARDLMGDDFWAYGLAANSHTLSTFLRYSHDQGLADRLYQPRELFAPETTEDHKV